MTEKERQRRCRGMVRNIKLAYGSLKTHLPWAIDTPVSDREHGDEMFHAVAIHEYAQQILNCAKELKHLNKRHEDTSTKTPIQPAYPVPSEVRASL